YLRAGKLKEARPHLQHIATHHATSAPAEAAWARRTLAVLTVLEGGTYKDLRDALAALGVEPERMTKASDDTTIQDQQTRARLLAVQQGRRDRGEAIKILQKLVEQGAARPEDHFLLASLYEANGEWEKARKRFADLVA